MVCVSTYFEILWGIRHRVSHRPAYGIHIALLWPLFIVLIHWNA